MAESAHNRNISFLLGLGFLANRLELRRVQILLLFQRMNDLENFLHSALQQQLRSRARKSHKNAKQVADDFVRRLSEKALYRRLINESTIAQDGIRFIFWFSGPGRGECTLEEWREIVDRHMRKKP